MTLSSKFTVDQARRDKSVTSSGLDPVGQPWEVQRWLNVGVDGSEGFWLLKGQLSGRQIKDIWPQEDGDPERV